MSELIAKAREGLGRIFAPPDSTGILNIGVADAIEALINAKLAPLLADREGEPPQSAPDAGKHTAHNIVRRWEEEQFDGQPFAPPCREALVSAINDALRASPPASVPADVVEDITLANATLLERDKARDVARGMMKALEPFDEYAGRYDDSYDDSVELWQDGRRVIITVGMLRAARAALQAARAAGL